MKYKVHVPVYEGPLDLLIYLVKKNEIDICNIPVAQITHQYLEYLELMRLLDLDIAGDFLVMAATLMYIKSKMLLPPEESSEETEEDPRQELVNRLLEYQRYKEVAGFLGKREVERVHLFTNPRDAQRPRAETEYVEASIFDLIGVFSKVLVSLPEEDQRSITEEAYSVEEKIGAVIDILREKSKLIFTELFGSMRSRIEVISTFLAVLELIRMKEVTVRQERVFGDIYLVRMEKP